MNNCIKLFSLTLFFLSLCATSIAQKRNFSISPIIGLTVPILDKGSGLHFAVNPAYAVSSRFSIESQLSYSYANIDGKFLSGEKDFQENFNALIGGRLYVLSDEKKIRPYFNLLLGGMLNRRSDYEEYIFGLSTGFFVDINRFLVGLSLETPGYGIFKVGYVF